jgi:hypothetical protein
VRTGVSSRGDVPAGPRSTEHDEMRLLRDPRAGPPVELQGVGELPQLTTGVGVTPVEIGGQATSLNSMVRRGSLAGSRNVVSASVHSPRSSPVSSHRN